ncbi:MAG TPA: hypothetical protein VGW78_02515 [Candidatus Babeliales bacterium]|jgi:hypothetical protein|nr:hypothetical protein [Candidatus Babeliales bacterium]
MIRYIKIASFICIFVLNVLIGNVRCGVFSSLKKKTNSMWGKKYVIFPKKSSDPIKRISLSEDGTIYSVEKQFSNGASITYRKSGIETNSFREDDQSDYSCDYIRNFVLSNIPNYYNSIYGNLKDWHLLFAGDYITNKSLEDQKKIFSQTASKLFLAKLPKKV